MLRIRSMATVGKCFEFEAQHRTRRHPKRGPDVKAVRFHEYGGPEVLRYEDVEQPVPGPGRCGCASRRRRSTSSTTASAAATCRAPSRWPCRTPRASRSPARSTRWATASTALPVGDEVVGFLPMVADGAAAEYVVAPAEVLTRAPSGVELARRRRAADGGPHRLAGAVRRREADGRAARADQRRGRGRGRLRRAAREARRRPRRRHRQPAQQCGTAGGGRRRGRRPHHHRGDRRGRASRSTSCSTSPRSPRRSWARSSAWSGTAASS